MAKTDTERRADSRRYTAKYRAAHPDRIQTKNSFYSARWRAENPEKAQASDKASRAKRMAEQPAHVREMERKKRARQRAANPEKARVDQTNNSALRRARLRSAPIIERVDRMVVAERDGWICQLCDGPIDPTLIFPDPWHLNVDHIVPLVKGGEHSYSNSQATHFRCNNSKRDKMPDTNRGGQRA